MSVRNFVRGSMAVAFMICSAGNSASVGVLPSGEAAGDQKLSPFYRWTQPLPKKAGLPLRQEAMPNPLTPEHAGKALRILYTSTDGRWGSGLLPVSGALYVPKGKAPKGGWKLIVWAHGTVGVADVCAPSWTGSNGRDRSYIDVWLQNGYAVVAPDYQGLGGPGPHAYSIWESEGRSVLDAARAALRLDRHIANSIVITGQSQGSGASIGAARLAADYAPDLKVKGAIASALISTIADRATQEAVPPLGDSPHYLVYRMIGGGIPDGAGQPEDFISVRGKPLLAAARTQCSPRDVTAKEGITLDNAFSRPVSKINAILGPVGAMSPFKIKIPLMLATGLADDLITPTRQGAFVKAVCASGNVVVWKRYEATAHGATLTRSSDDAQQFATTVLAGGAVKSDCPSL